MPAGTDIPLHVEKVVYEALVRFGVEPDQIARNASFEALDVDSLDLAELSQIVEEEFGVRLEASDLEHLKSVGDALDLIAVRAG